MSSTDGSSAERIQPPQVIARLDRLVRLLAARGDIPHAVLGIVTSDGARWIGAAGSASPDGRPMQPGTPYFIASITKLYIAAAVMRLWRRNVLQLDEPAAAYISGTSIRGIHRIGGVDHTGSLTIRHLLGHTSGLPDYVEDRPPGGGRSLFDDIAAGADRSWYLEDVLEIVRDRLAPRFPPQDLSTRRQRAYYSDTNYVLLIAVIEGVTGRPLHDALEQLLFQPLGLTRTWRPGHSGPAGQVAPPAMIWHGASPLHVPLALASTGDLYSTVDDTLDFLGSLVSGKLFGEPSTLAIMQERWNRIFFPLRYGLGMMRFRVSPPFAPGLRRLSLLGHSGSTGSWLFQCPELKLLMAGTVDQLTARTLPFRFLPKVLRAVAR